MNESGERRYSDEELRWILHEATRRERLAMGSSHEVDERTEPRDGLTLREILEVAREVELDPAAVEQAARDLPASRVNYGFSRSRNPFAGLIGTEFVAPWSLGDREMREVALEAERVLDTRGAVLMSSDAMEWSDHESRLRVRVARDGSATRVRVSLDQGWELVTGSVVLTAGGLFGAALVAVMIPGGVLALPLVAGATVGAVWLHALGRSATAREQVRALSDHLEHMVRLTSEP